MSPSPSPCPTGMERLPEELLLQVLTYLDTVALSELNLRDEPSLALTASTTHVLKDVSRVSKLWRRLGTPLLFKHARLRLDRPPQPHWADCPVCNETTLHRRRGGEPAKHGGDDVERYHVDMFDDAITYLAAHSSSAENGDIAPTRMWQIFSDWAPRFYHSLKDFLDFISRNELATKIDSLVVVTQKMLADKLHRFPHRAAVESDWRYRCAATLWQHLLSVIDLQRIVILAPPTDLACLTNCAIDTFGDWAFGDMEFHILDLRLDRTNQSPSPLSGKQVDYASLDHTPHRFPGIAGSSLLNLRPWRHISINEGAFLKAYGTYEYFERGPPSLIYSIKDCLTPRSTYGANVQRLSGAPLASLRKLTYIAIFPFANHLDFRELLPQLEELDLQLAPRIYSQILDQRERVGKAELQDCWSELVSIYQNLVAQLATFRISERNMPRLKLVTCRDVEREALREELDEVFIPLCMPVWCEAEPGIFERLKGSADTVAGLESMST